MKNLRITLPEKKLATKSMRNFAEEQIKELKNAFDNYEHFKSAAIVVKIRNNGITKLELTISTDKNSYRRELSGEDYYELLPLAISEIEDAIYNHRDKIRSKKRKQNIAVKYNSEELVEDIVEEENTSDNMDFIIKEAPRAVMSKDDAILALEKIGHSFFLFEDIQTGNHCVAYKRENCSTKYGIIEQV